MYIIAIAINEVRVDVGDSIQFTEFWRIKDKTNDIYLGIGPIIVIGKVSYKRKNEDDIPDSSKRRKTKPTAYTTWSNRIDQCLNGRKPGQQKSLYDIVQHIRDFQASIRQCRPGDAEYTEIAKQTIGGSNLGTLFGVNIHESSKELVYKIVDARLGQQKPLINVPCGWGIALEQVVVAYISHHLQCNLYCRNQCITDIPDVPNFRYSPDGIGVVHMTDRGMPWTISMAPDIRADKKCVLFEIKCPLSRWPDGSIPELYKPQVRGGLVATNEYTQRAIFVDTMFRICSLAELDDSSLYNTRFHSHSEFLDGIKPLARGVLNIYQTQPNDSEPIDYGSMDENSINEMLCGISARVLTARLATLTFLGGVTLEYSKARLHLVGYMPFKFMKINYIPENPPDKDFSNRLKLLIEKHLIQVDQEYAKRLNK